MKNNHGIEDMSLLHKAAKIFTMHRACYMLGDIQHHCDDTLTHSPPYFAMEDLNN